MTHANDALDRRPKDPTPEQIRRRSAAIRRRWSAEVAQRRMVWEVPRWMPPELLTIDLAFDTSVLQD